MRLLKREKVGNRIQNTWMHYGSDGRKKLTVETVEDTEPVFNQVKQVAQASRKTDFRLKASIPATLIDEAAKTSAKLWGVSVREAFSEICTGKTDRGVKALRLLTEGRDYNKLQTKTYQ